MSSRPYCETFTTPARLFKYISDHQTHRLGNSPKVRSASNWGRDELLGCHVVFKTTDHGNFLNVTGKIEPSNEWDEVIDDLDESLTETDLSRKMSGTAASFWAALRIITNAANEEAATAEAINRPSRFRAPLQNNDYFDSGTMQVGSSSPTYPSSEDDFQGRGDSDFIAKEEHGKDTLPEDATVVLVSAFLKHALIWCPGQAPSDNRKALLEFSPVRQKIIAHLPDGVKFEATSDGEIFRLEPKHGRFNHVRDKVIALVEAKRRFETVQDGKATISDGLLGQAVGEALALRTTAVCTRTAIIVVIAVRHYLCFLSVHVPDEYMEGDQKQVITVTSTPWIDLCHKPGRKNALHNAARVAEWSSGEMGDLIR
ncbi:hypothetical protein RB595_006573 [Gaeumannomyces hyphopodioides]